MCSISNDMTVVPATATPTSKSVQFVGTGVLSKQRTPRDWAWFVMRQGYAWSILIMAVMMQIFVILGAAYGVTLLASHAKHATVVAALCCVAAVWAYGVMFGRDGHLGIGSYLKARAQNIVQCTLHMTTLWMSAAFLVMGSSYGSTGVLAGALMSVALHLPTNLLPFRKEADPAFQWLDDLLWANEELTASAQIVIDDPDNEAHKHGGPRLFAAHPHGNIPLRVFQAINLHRESLFKKSVLFFGSQIALVPPYRVYIWLRGGMMPITKHNLEAVLQQRENNVIICPGGVHEMLVAEPYRPRIRVSRKHKGFIRMCVKHGYNIVPMFDFGNNDVLHQSMRFIETFVYKQTGVPCGIIWTNRFFLPLQNNIPLQMAVGVPIVVEKTESPTKEYIDMLHDKHWRALDALFDKYKAQFGFGDRQLEWVDV